MPTENLSPVELPDIIVGSADYENLTALAEKLGGPLAEAGEALLNELDRATIVPQHEVPADTVRMNSVVTFLSSDGSERSYKLVVPEQADIDNNRVSVLTPIGRALLGLRAGDRFPWTGRDGQSHMLTVKSVGQED